MRPGGIEPPTHIFEVGLERFGSSRPSWEPPANRLVPSSPCPQRLGRFRLVSLAVVVGAIVAADVLRDDAGFVAATLMGVALGNQRFLPAHRRVDVSVALGFHEALVQLLIGVLFVLIAASVSPDDVRAVLARALVLVLAMLLVVRPLVVAVALARSQF